mmetsp:Transcript_60154/g.137974  ORF Transcript_60154/g.137974 Transcript_60154/m.137974 type:complete len:262 (-) Transcript_60154:344-1129(-)
MASRVASYLSRRRGLAFMPTKTSASTVMAICTPFEHNLSSKSAMLVVPPLLEAVRGLDVGSRPFRIVSHMTDDGLAFNCAYFHSTSAFTSYRSWFVEKALTPGGDLYASHQMAFEDPAEMPDAATWLWGTGQKTLSDTRMGEYQIGMGTRYSRMIFRDAAARAEAEEMVLTPEYEARRNEILEAAGISYFGRLVMADESGNGWFTSSQYGSHGDAQKGIAAVRKLMGAEMDRWYSRYDTVSGSIASTWLVTPPDREVGGSR